MHEDNGIKITTYDILLRAWENSMELTRDFEKYSKKIEDNQEAVNVFKKFAEDECVHASTLHSMLLDYTNNNGNKG